MFHGYITALITPFTAEGGIDKPALKKLVDRQIEQGISGIVPVGTTGESPTLSHEEHHGVVQEVRKAGCRSLREPAQTARRRRYP